MPPRTPHELASDIAAMASNMVALERAATRPEIRRTFNRNVIGAEMIKLLKNPAIDVQYKLRTYHYVPKGGATSYREHL